MSSLRPNQTAMVKTISSLIGPPPEGVACAESMLSGDLEQGLTLLYLLVNLLSAPPLVLRPVSLLDVTLSRLYPMHPLARNAGPFDNR